MTNGRDDPLMNRMLKLPKDKISELKDYRVIIGFSGFGNVGYLSLTHIAETIELKSIAFWGDSSWYHKGRLESLLTVYEHELSKTIIVLPRLPVHVSSVPQKYWDQLAYEVLSWQCKEYIIIGGLREDTRHFGSVDWAAYVPTPRWEESHEVIRTLNDHLPMIGPLSSFIMLGTSLNLPVLGLLAYCEMEEDPSAAIVAVNEIVKLTGLPLTNTSELVRFDFSFIPNSVIPISPKNFAETNVNYEDVDDDEDDDGDDDIPGYDLNELL